MTATRAFAAATVLACSLGAAAGVAAHDGGARLVVAPDPVNPGGVIEIRGDDLGADQPIALVLVGASGSVAIGGAATDGEGHFVSFVQLPADLPVGRYAVEAEDEGGDVVAASLAVAGAPVVDPEEPAGRDEDDPLLIALPPGWQQSLASAPVTARPAAATAPAARPAVSTPAPPLLAAAIAFGVTLIGGTMLVRRRRRSIGVS